MIPAQMPPLTDMITFSVSGASGSDTVHFVFNQAGNGPNITLTGTAGKDVIFATESNDYLDRRRRPRPVRVRAAAVATCSTRSRISRASLDRLDLRQFTAIDSIANVTVAQQGNDTLITLDSHDTVLLQNVIATNVHASNFLFHV